MGWQYLGMAPEEVMKLTPREFTLLLNAQRERTYDELESEAVIAVMHRVATNKERLKMSDVYERPGDSYVQDLRGQAFEKKVDEAERAQAFLSSIKFD